MFIILLFFIVHNYILSYLDWKTKTYLVYILYIFLTMDID